MTGISVETAVGLLNFGYKANTSIANESELLRLGFITEQVSKMGNLRQIEDSAKYAGTLLGQGFTTEQISKMGSFGLMEEVTKL